MTATADITVAAAAASDTGLVRDNNEDSVLARLPVFVVADGMGGYEAGEVASAAVVAAFERVAAGRGVLELEDVRRALADADAAVREVASRTRRGAGSTVAGLALIDYDGVRHWLVFNVGDSRVYRHVGSTLDRLTVDHSLGQELVDAGELAPADLDSFPKRNVITRAMGAANATADSWLMPVVDGERLLVCSDGLTTEVTDEGIRATLTMSGGPESAAEALVRRARHAGGRDNISVIVVDVLSGGAPPETGETTGLPSTAAGTGAHTTTVPVRGRA